MQAAAHDAAFARRNKIPQEVAQEFVETDKAEPARKKIKKRYGKR